MFSIEKRGNKTESFQLFETRDDFITGNQNANEADRADENVNSSSVNHLTSDIASQVIMQKLEGLSQTKYDLNWQYCCRGQK